MADEQEIFTSEEEDAQEIYSTDELFSDPEFPQTPNIQSDDMIDVTAGLAAVSQRNQEPSIPYDELVRQNRELIAIGEEVVLRREAEFRKAAMRSTALDELAFDALRVGNVPEAEAFVDLEMSGAFQASEQIDDSAELERQAIGDLQNAEMVDDPDYASEIQSIFADDTGSTLDIVRDEATKFAYFQKKLDEYRESIKRKGIDRATKRLNEATAIAFIPFYDTQSRLNLRINEDGEPREPLEFITAGNAVKRQIEGLFAMGWEEGFKEETDKVFENALDQSGLIGQNELAALYILEQYEKGTMGAGGVFLDNVVGFVDAIPVAAGLFRLGRGTVAGPAHLAKLAGARRTSAIMDADLILKTLKTNPEAPSKVGSQQVNAVADLVPSAMKPGIDEGIGISGSLSKKLEEIDAVGKELEGITTSGRLSDTQLDELVTRKIKDIEKNSTHVIEDTKRVVDPQTKIATVETYIGKKAGGGYATENAAKGAAARRGFENYDIVQENGHWFIRQQHVVEELAPNGMPRITRPDNSAEAIPTTGPIKAGVVNPDRSLPADLVARRHESEMAAIKFREKIVKPLEKFLQPFNKQDLRHLNTIMTKGRNEKRWFTADEFAIEWKKTTGKDPREYHFAGYAAAIKANNVDHVVRNLHVYTERARRGVKTIEIKDRKYPIDNVNGVERTGNVEELAKLRMFDLEDRIVRSGAKDTPAEEVADLQRKLESGDYKVISFEEAVRIEGDPVHTMLVPNGSVNIKPLIRQQVNYVAGGHLIRRTPWFGKQARVGKYKDGTEYVEAPNTLFAYRTEKSGKDHLDEINSALRKYNDYLSARTDAGSVQNAFAKVAIRREIAESPFESLDNLERLVAEGKIDPTREIELVYDRGLPREYWQQNGLLENPNVHKIFNAKQDVLDGTTQWTRTTGRDYYGKRTEGLMSPHEMKDVVLDPLASVSKGLENAARTYAFDHYLNRSIEEWVRLAGPYFEVASLGGSSDVRAAFYNGRLTEQLKINDPNLYRKLEENRVLIKNVMGIRTPSQEVYDAAKRNLARFIENTAPGKMGTRVTMWADDIQSNNPINAINGLVFDAWLGMGDVSQLWVQTQTILTATAASPKYGARAISMLYPMRWLTVNKSENLLDYIAKNGKPLHGQDPNDFKMMVRQYRDSGWNAPGGEFAYLANHSNSIGGAGVIHNINRARRGLRFLFNEAERWNRMVAWQIAWKELSEKFPKLNKTSDEWRRLMDKSTSDYSINMTSISNSKIQKGIFSPMTRFMGYQFRLLEAMLPKSLWGNPAFSNAAKARMASAQLLLYGSKGAPFGHKINDIANDLYEQVTGTPLTEEESKFVESGAIDALIYTISGGELNTDVAERAGFGRGLDYTFERMSDGSMSSALAAYGGPAFSFSSRYAESVRRVMTYFKGTRGPLDLDVEDAKFVVNELFVKHVNFAKRIDKARMIWRLGMVLDPKTGRPLFNASDLEGAAALLGVPLYEETQLYKQYELLEDYDKEVKFNGQLLARLDREAFRLMSEGNFRGADLTTKQAALILAQFQDDPRKMEDIASYATNELNFTGTQWEALLKRIESRLGEEALPPQGLRYEDVTDEE